MKTIISILALSLNISTLAFAQDKTKQQDSATHKEQKTKIESIESKSQSTEVKTEQTVKNKTTQPDKRFIPSEQISEDLSVSFPIDI